MKLGTAQQDRIRYYEFSQDQTLDFLAACHDINIHDLHFMPYKRYLLSGHLLEAVGEDFQQSLNKCLRDYASGCAILAFGQGLTQDDQIKISTAVSHLISEPAVQGPGGNYYGITKIVDDDNPKFKLMFPYEDFSLHTDGVFEDNPVDWLMMMKLREHQVSGGHSRLLHMADWEAYDIFHDDPGNQSLRHGLLEKDGRYNVFRKFSTMEPSHSAILYKRDSQRRVKFVDQYVIPRTINQARFIARFQLAIEQSRHVRNVALPPGSMIILNNHFWMHGRSKFERHPQLEREQLRQYGCF